MKDYKPGCPPWADSINFTTFDYGHDKSIAIRVGPVSNAVRQRGIKVVKEEILGRLKIKFRKPWTWQRSVIRAAEWEELPFDEAAAVAAIKDWFVAQIPIYERFLKVAKERGLDDRN